MRQLHPVSFHEKFVAGGAYAFYDGDTTTGDVEEWTMHEPGPGSLTLRADRHRAHQVQSGWLFEGLLTFRDGLLAVERYDIQSIGAEMVGASYIFDETYVTRTFTRDDEVVSSEEIDLPRGYAVMPPFAVAMNLFIPSYAASGRMTCTAFESKIDAIRFALGDFTLLPVTLALLAEGEHIIEGKRYVTHGYRATTEISGYARHWDCWYDAYNVLMLEEFEDHRAALIRYVHRPERTQS
jgi:hypothetical protein